jgi:hypothetical protein
VQHKFIGVSEDYTASAFRVVAKQDTGNKQASNSTRFYVFLLEVCFHCLLELMLDLEDESSMFLRNVSEFLLDCKLDLIGLHSPAST